MNKNSGELFKNVESVADELASTITSFPTVDHYYSSLAENLRSDEEFLVNKNQLYDLTRLIACPGGIEPESYHNFLMGAVVGYDALKHLNSDKFYQETYSALSDLYAYGQLSIRQIELNNNAELNYVQRQTMVGLYINFVLDKDLAFNTISSDEQHVIFELAKYLDKSDDEAYDFYRGYQLIRSAPIWHSKYKNERDLILNKISQSNFVDDMTFYEILGFIDIDPNIAIGDQDISKDIRVLIRNFNHFRNQVYQSKLLTENNIEDLSDFLYDKMSDYFHAMQNIIVLDTIKAKNQGIILVCDDEYNLTEIVPIYGNIELHAKIVGYDVMPVPSAKWYEELFDVSTDYVSPKIELETFGLVFELDEANLYENGDLLNKLGSESKVFLPIGYDNLSIYKTFVEFDDNP